MYSIQAYLKQLKIYLKRPISIFDNWATAGRLNWMPDKWYLSLMFRSKMGYWMNWKDPKTFNEKLQWLKVHDRNPLYTQLVDKYEVRKYIAERIGSEYLIPLLGVWDKVDDIDFEQLPNQFVLKCTHDSGSAIICRGKNNFNATNAKTKLCSCLSHNYYYYAREWPYKDVSPKIIAEKYLTDNNDNDGITDYKYFCFNGTPKFMYISHDRSTVPTTDFFDMDFHRLRIRMKDPNSTIEISKPSQFEKMKELATILAQEIPHIRVDFYCTKGKVYFGEMTFFHNAGFFPIEPKSMAMEIGNLLSYNQSFS